MFTSFLEDVLMSDFSSRRSTPMRGSRISYPSSALNRSSNTLNSSIKWANKAIEENKEQDESDEDNSNGKRF